MRLRFVPVALCLLAVLGEAGCGASDDAPLAGRGVQAVEDGFGGPDRLREFFDTHTTADIAQALKPYGVGFVAHATASSEADTAAPQKISDCDRFFPASDRNTWHKFDGEFYFIDAAGRPSRAYADLPPVVPAPRVNACQTRIGQWGDAEDPSNDYDGGHMIGSQLGGWGGRANVVPQDANFNRGTWAALENKMADCRRLPAGQMRYSIAVSYPDDVKLVPDGFGMQIDNPSQATHVTLAFENIDGGGPSGVADKARGVAYLSANGCN